MTSVARPYSYCIVYRASGAAGHDADGSATVPSCLPSSPAIAVFAKRLAQARALRGLSQRALGEALGLGKATGGVRINRYESQASHPDIETAARIAKELDVPLAFLYAESDDLADWILAYTKLSKADRKRAMAELKARLEQAGK
jgi:transcriptional regulator with XRE-family HTH domain